MLGFIQVGRHADLCHTFFLPASKFFLREGGGVTPRPLLTKAQALALDLYVPPPRHEPRGLDLNLQDLMHKLGPNQVCVCVCLSPFGPVAVGALCW